MSNFDILIVCDANGNGQVWEHPRDDLALLHLALMTEMHLVSMFYELKHTAVSL